ncbi:MAG: rod shape-determining protein MreC, partial [Arcobacter sp.]|nr:rod shape-determining protein MreC [Arcobacter sp.]
MRKFLFLIVFIIVALFYLFRWDKLLIEEFTFFTDIKISYINKMINFSTTLEKYFNQAKIIERLREENNTLKLYKSLYIMNKNKLVSLNKYHLLKNNIKDSNIQLVKVLSYINFNDFTKVWLDLKKEDENILGLISNEYAAGIVINENNRAVALLNGNKKCSYAVFIGDKKVPGILTSSKNGKELLIKYIPAWSEIKENDEVITSGMDNIFFEGLKVG